MKTKNKAPRRAKRHSCFLEDIRPHGLFSLAGDHLSWEQMGVLVAAVGRHSSFSSSPSPFVRMRALLAAGEFCNTFGAIFMNLSFLPLCSGVVFARWETDGPRVFVLIDKL